MARQALVTGMAPEPVFINETSPVKDATAGTMFVDETVAAAASISGTSNQIHQYRRRGRRNPS